MKTKTVITTIVGVIAGLGLFMGTMAYAQDYGHMGSTQGTGMMGQTSQNSMHGQTMNRDTHGSMHGQTVANNNQHGKIQRTDTCHGADKTDKTDKVS